MHRATPVEPMDPNDWSAATFKAVLITLIVMALLGGVMLPAIVGEAGPGVVPCVVVQMAMTTLFVGGWFVLFLCFDKHLGDSDH